MSHSDKITAADIRQIEGHVAAAVRAVLAIWIVSASLGFAFSYFFGKVL